MELLFADGILKLKYPRLWVRLKTVSTCTF